MGLINHDTLIHNGIPCVNTYVCISNAVIKISFNKINNLYLIEIPYFIYYSQDVKNNGYGPLINSSFLCSLSVLPQDMYNYCYQELKNLYTNYSDA
jgi:hypothetical protein